MKYGVVTLTEGNINHGHFYLTELMTMFPASVVGGSSKADAAAEHIEVHHGCGEPERTDIAGDKKIFRSRGWVSRFFDSHGLKAGDRVVVQLTGERRVHVYPARNG